MFGVTITNGRSKPLRTHISDYEGQLFFSIEDNLRLREDMDGNRYYALSQTANQDRLINRGRQTIDIKNGFEAVRTSLLEVQLRSRDWRVAGGETVEGYVPFYSIKPNATNLLLAIPVEIASDSEAGRAQKLNFIFPLTFSRAIYEQQPATIRY